MLLLQHNADVTIMNAEGLSVKQLAKNAEIKCLIEGGYLSTVTELGFRISTPLLS